MHALKITNLHKSYSNGAKAIDGINLEIMQGDLFALIGPNGAGKSTTMGIITSLIEKSSGDVKIFEHCLDKNPRAAKSTIGVMPQEFNFSLLEKVQHILIRQAGYYGVETKDAYQRSEYYLKRLNLWHKRNEESRQLSGGEKRRLMLARAMIHEPQLLVLDEPTANMDIETRRDMWDFLRDTNENGRTILLTTHYLEEAESLCNNIAIMDHGKIIANSSMDNLLQKLSHETLVLYLDKPIKTTPPLIKYDCIQLNDRTLEVSIDKEQNINDLIHELSHQGVIILRMRNKTNRLEELFIKLTSKQYT